MHRPSAPTASSALHRPTARRVLTIAALATLTTLTACVVAPPQPRFMSTVVMSAPPVAPVEVLGPAPAPGYLWISGYWNWVGGRHVWVSGRWEAPRAGYYWQPHVWVHTGVGWSLREGHWARR